MQEGGGPRLLIRCASPGFSEAVAALLARPEAGGWRVVAPDDPRRSASDTVPAVLYAGDLPGLAPALAPFGDPRTRRLAWVSASGPCVHDPWRRLLAGCRAVAVSDPAGCGVLAEELAASPEVLPWGFDSPGLAARLGAWVGRALSDPPPEEAGSRVAASPAIVIRRSVGLGDVIFALSVAEAAAAAAPQAPLHFVTDRRFTEFVSWFPFVSSVSEAFGALPSLPPGTLDADLNSMLPANGQDRIAVMARKLGLQVNGFVAPPGIPVQTAEAVSRRLGEQGIGPGRRLIGLAPFSTGRTPSRSMTVSEANDLAAALLPGAAPGGDGPAVVLLHNEAVPGLCLPAGAVDLSGRLSVSQAIAVVARCERFIGVDSGLLYAAAVFRVPSVALFSHIEPLSRLARARGYIALRPSGRACFPCGDFSGAPACMGMAGQHACMRAVSGTPRVVEALRDVAPGSREVREVPCADPPEQSRRAPRRGASVLFVVPWLIAGGGERHLLLLCQGLSRFADVEIAVVHPDRAAHLASEFAGWPVTRLNGEAGEKARALARLIDERRPDVIGFYSNPLTLDALQYARHRPRRLFAIIHTLFPHELEMLRHGANALVDAYVCVSEAVRLRVAESLPDEPRLVVIPNGVRLGDFDSCGSVRPELGFGPGDFIVGNIGRIAAGKNVDLIIRALPLLPEEVKGLFIGWGEDVESCQHLMWDLGVGHRVKLLGPTTDVAPRYRAMDAFILPSDIEGAIPYALLEAMAAGVPALVTPVSDVPNRFRDGQHLLLIERSPESIAAAVLRLLGDAPLRRNLAANARGVVERELAAERMVAEYARILGLPWYRENPPPALRSEIGVQPRP